MRIDPNTLSPGRRYFLMTSCIIPRPIAWAGTCNEAGGYNLAPFSFFNGMAATPPLIVIGFSAHEDKGQKDTLRNVLRTGELTVNIANEQQAEAVQASAEDQPYGTDEFALTGLTPVPGEVVAAPRVAEAKISLECTLHQHIPVGDAGASIILAQIRLFHLLDTLIDNRGTVDPSRLRPLGRLSAGLFCSIGDIFKVPREG
jgi:flavin reductase (DIM6/NTAB) family NADH-FMN oxidoreductase RutF